jgi:hypothetical protein
VTNPQTPSIVFQHYAHQLRIAAPQEYERLVEVLDAYATEVALSAVNAEQNDVLVAQGRARAFIYILRLLREAGVKQTPPPASPPSA